MALMPQRDAFRHDGAARDQAARQGMWIFVIVVVVLFAASILGYLVVRLNPHMTGPWRTADEAGLPWTLLLSTAALLASSATLHQSLSRVRRGDQRGCTRFAIATYWLGVSFVLLQGEAWWSMWRQRVVIDENLYAWTFYLLTALHVIHIIGGLFGLGVVARRAGEGAYSAASHNGIVVCGIYWHSLDVIWLALYATLWLGSR